MVRPCCHIWAPTAAQTLANWSEFETILARVGNSLERYLE